MKNIQRILIVMVVATIALPLALSCDRDTYEIDPDPPCSPFIQDEDYEGPTRMLLGFGRGAIIATNLRGQFPDRFGALATIGGPISLAGLIAQVEDLLTDYDNWSDEISRTERLVFMEELFKAFGNPLYFSNDSNYYPPGTSADDFSDPETFEPKTINGFIDRLNPNGSLPVVTFADQIGKPVSFALALDQNQNGVRDLGEPIIIQIHETFTDINGNGVYDLGEVYTDRGLDGIANTFDYGEANGKFDYSQVAKKFFDSDLYEITPKADTENHRNFVGSFFSDIGVNNPWDFDYVNQILFDRMPDLVSGKQDANCIIDEATILNEYLWDEVYPLNKPFIHERFVWLQTPDSDDSDLDPADETSEPVRTRRLLQALFFLSSRSPNGNLNRREVDSNVIFENHTFISTTAHKIRYSIGLPAGYYDEVSMWKTYPVMYIFPDKGYAPEDFRDILADQGWLADIPHSQQILLVIVDPDGEEFGLEGYSYFTGPADQSDNQVNAEELFEEIMTHVEERFRANLN